MDKKKKARTIALTIVGLLILVVGVPLGINASYQCGTVIIATQWGAEDMLNYYGAILGSSVTLAGLAITIRFTMRQIQRDSYLKTESDKWAKTEAVVVNILDEINSLPVLQQVMDTGFTDPSKAINALQKYQMTCRSATDLLCAYINSADYPQVKGLVDLIKNVAEKLFQVSQKEINQYSKLRELESRKSALKLLEMAERRPGVLSAEEIAKHRETIKNTDGIRFEDIEHAIQESHMEIIRIYEADFRSLLQQKGVTFEMISAQTLSNADAILSLRRK